MGKLAGWSFNYTETATCPKCGMEKCSKKKNDCCKDEHKLLKIDATQKIIECNLHFTPLLAIVIPHSYTLLHDMALPSVTEEHPNNNAPPRKKTIPLYITNCTFLI